MEFPAIPNDRVSANSANDGSVEFCATFAGRFARRSILSVYGSASSTQHMAQVVGERSIRLIQASTTARAIAILEAEQVDLVVLDLEHAEPGVLNLCRLLKGERRTQFIPVYFLATAEDAGLEARAFEAGADDFLLKPIRAAAFRARVTASLKQKDAMETIDAPESVLFSLAQSVESRDPELGQHCQRLATMAGALGLALGLPGEEILTLQRGGYLHDIGKVSVPDSVLYKCGPLTSEEWETMKTHSERGERICCGLKSLQPVLPIIRHHHERWDGSGYPDRLRGEDIPLLARVLQLADIYDALTTERSYKAALTSQQAIRILGEEAARGWRDPKLTGVFAEIAPLFENKGSELAGGPLSLHALGSSLDKLGGYHQAASRRRIAPGMAGGLKLVSGF